MDTKTFLERMSFARKCLLISVGETVSYKSWSDEFRVKNIKEQYERIFKGEQFSFPTDDQITAEQLKDLGFGLWDEERNAEGRTLWLIPLWMMPFMKYGQSVVSIMGEAKTIDKDIDLDHRGGCVAFGFMLKA